jgi:hypothetical protein
MNREMIVKTIFHIMDTCSSFSPSPFISKIIPSSRNEHQQSDFDRRPLFDFPCPLFPISYNLIIDLQIIVLVCRIPFEMFVCSFVDIHYLHLDLPET